MKSKKKSRQATDFDALTELVNPILWVVLLVMVAICGLIWAVGIGGGL